MLKKIGVATIISDTVIGEKTENKNTYIVSLEKENCISNECESVILGH